MKKMLLSSFALLFLTVTSFAQQTKPVSQKKSNLLQKKSDKEIIAAKKLNKSGKAAALKVSPIISPTGEREEVQL